MGKHYKRILSLALICAIIIGCQCIITWPTEVNATPFAASTEPDTTPTTSIPDSTIPEPMPLPPSTGFIPQKPLSQAPVKPTVSIPKLSAKRFFIYDTGSEEFLYINCDTEKAIYPASTTKLFTTYVALQYLSPETIVTVGKELSYVASDASAAGFRQGDRVSVEALAYGALLPSGCDASYILAAAAGKVILSDKNATAKSAINAFMEECNRIAKQLGMKNTNLVNPDGYHHKDHRISMQAFAIIGTHCLNNKLIARIVASTKATVTYTNSSGKTRTLQFQNTNHCIHPNTDYYNAYCVGLKTGYTSDAGYCLLTAYEIDGRYILIGIFGCSSSKDRFKDANKLFNAYLPHL